MKRKTIQVDEHLLAEATRLLNAPNPSAAVTTALKEIISKHQRLNLRQFFNTGIWQGNLAEMRDDQPTR
jgi:Arc/MetJ family transcription regulator